MGGGGSDPAPASSPATTESAESTGSAPAPARSAVPAAPVPAAVPAAVEPTPPWVEAARTRQKIPFWAIPVLGLLPLWAVVYALTLDPATNANGPVAVGADVYANKGCAACHGAAGAGNGNIPALVGPAGAVKEFPRPADQVAWVALGSAGWLAAGNTKLPGGRQVAGGMPAWAASLTPEELMAVVLHERAVLDGEAFDPARWEKGFADTLKQYVPDQAAAYIAVLDEWKTTPPA